MTDLQTGLHPFQIFLLTYRVFPLLLYSQSVVFGYLGWFKKVFTPIELVTFVYLVTTEEKLSCLAAAACLLLCKTA